MQSLIDTYSSSIDFVQLADDLCNLHKITDNQFEEYPVKDFQLEILSNPAQWKMTVLDTSGGLIFRPSSPRRVHRGRLYVLPLITQLPELTKLLLATTSCEPEPIVIPKGMLI
uniref:Uncharacterized protein n=1 Tax=Pithovirus LCPAC101 TaxID=2506586 RepID=A0A481Z2W7_9VIRU|nr:MAG: hypothetical protein LCPAC101_03610 [Pithovirus LCPAC101]